MVLLLGQQEIFTHTPPDQRESFFLVLRIVRFVHLCEGEPKVIADRVRFATVERIGEWMSGLWDTEQQNNKKESAHAAA